MFKKISLGIVVLAIIAVGAALLMNREPAEVSPTPTATPTPLPSPTETATPPTPTEPTVSPTPSATPEVEELVFTEEELQSKLDQIVEFATQSGSAQLSYIRVKLLQDKMLVSIEGKALGTQAKAEDMEVWFEGKTVFASGEVKALGLGVEATLEAEVNSEHGKPKVEIKEAEPSFALTFIGLSKSQISDFINDAIESTETEFPIELESIYIEDGKLILVGK